MTAYMILFLWAAQAFVEYKIIDASPEFVKKVFHNKIGGIVISILIGTAVAFALGIPNGFIVGAANFIGLATNNYTYPFIKSTSRKATQVKTTVDTFKTEHPTVVTNFVSGLKGIGLFIGSVIVAVGFCFRSNRCSVSIRRSSHPFNQGCGDKVIPYAAIRPEGWWPAFVDSDADMIGVPVTAIFMSLHEERVICPDVEHEY